MDDEQVSHENNFSYRETKDQRILIYWLGHEVMVLKGKAAVKLKAQLKGRTEIEKQLALAKVTGNFKRGNEREGKSKR